MFLPFMSSLPPPPRDHLMSPTPTHNISLLLGIQVCSAEHSSHENGWLPQPIPPIHIQMVLQCHILPSLHQREFRSSPGSHKTQDPCHMGICHLECIGAAQLKAWNASCL